MSPNLEMTRLPNISRTAAIDCLAVCDVAPSCWNQAATRHFKSSRFLCHLVYDLRNVLKFVMFLGNEAFVSFRFSSFSFSDAKAPHALRLSCCCPHWSWFYDFRLQFLKSFIFRFSSPESSHLRARQPSLLLRYGL